MRFISANGHKLVNLYIIALIIMAVAFAIPLRQADNATVRNGTRILVQPPDLTFSSEIVDSLTPDDEKRYTYDQGIIFPDSEEVFFEEIPTIEDEPKCAQGNTYCERLDDYPYRRLKNIIRPHQGFDVFFGDESQPDEFTNRIGEAEEKFVCESRERIIYPQGAKNKFNKWQLILNEKTDGYIQAVKVEECVRAERPCDVTVGVGYVTSCKQKFTYRKLVAVSRDGAPLVDSFLFPSACCCSYRLDTVGLFRKLPPTSPKR